MTERQILYRAQSETKETLKLLQDKQDAAAKAGEEGERFAYAVSGDLVWHLLKNINEVPDAASDPLLYGDKRWIPD